MDHIQDVYKKKPKMIEKIWDNLTKVNLKVDGKPFQVLYNEDEDELEYHGRSGNETKVGPLIDDMYRLFSKPINDAIRHIENRTEVFKRYKFLTFEVIDSILLLTAIITKDGKFIEDPDKIDDIAKELDTDVMPCLWKGKISEEQKEVLMQAISTDIVPTKDEFVKWVKELFGNYEKFPKTLISRSSEFIEGIVFFYEVDGKVVEYKLVDPTFRQMVKDNHAGMKKDSEENAEKYNEIYELFLNWAEENATGLDKNRMRSIEFNFIKMMEDAKLYNKLMKLGTGLTTITTDAYFLQPDRISDELKKAIKKHGKVYQLLYEKFVRLFYKAKKRGFVVSKEFQQRVNKVTEKFAEYSLNEDEVEINGKLTYGDLLTEVAHTIPIKTDKITNDITKTLLSNIATKYDITDNIGKIDTNNTSLKVFRKYFDYVTSYISSYCKNDGYAYTTRKNGDTIITYNKKQIFQIGDGSSYINTSEQEQATVEAWNNIGKNTSYNKEYLLDTKNYKLSNAYINNSSSWLISVAYQLLEIRDYIEKDFDKYTAYRLTKNITPEHLRFQKEYLKYINSTNKELQIKNINVFDPTDIILYKDDNKNVYDGENIEEQIKTYKENVLNKNVIPISLKKMSKENKPLKFNFDTNENDIKINIENVSCITQKKQKTECILTGKFNFGNLTYCDDVENPQQQSLNNIDELILTLRTFGNSIAIDIKINKNDPAFGKISIAVWRDQFEKYNKINEDIKKDLLTYQETFQKICDDFDNKDKKAQATKTLTELLKYGLKQNNNCLPFILIH